MIRRDLEDRLRAAARAYPVVTVTGPRQSGRSTLCRSVFPHRPLANLELPDVRRFALEDPRAFLAQFPRGAVLDEVQRTPEIASYLQPMVDADPTPGRWILTGSQNFALLDSVNESLAGRAAVLHRLACGYGELERAARVRAPPQTGGRTRPMRAPTFIGPPRSFASRRGFAAAETKGAPAPPLPLCFERSEARGIVGVRAFGR